MRQPPNRPPHRGIARNAAVPPPVSGQNAGPTDDLDCPETQNISRPRRPPPDARHRRGTMRHESARNTARIATRSAALLAVLLAGTAHAAAQDPLPLSDEHRKWLEEEVLYIISDREKDALENLQSEAEREAFIAAFWQRRDPEPLTPENEFLTEHYRRIEYANLRLGGESPVPGWMTDRGRIYIKLGEPDDRETFQAIPGLYASELWFYLQRKEMFLPPIYLLFFRDNNAGPYRLFNHLLDTPEDLMPAQALDMENSRRAAYEFLQEMSPQLAHATINMRADQGVTFGLALPDVANLETQTVLFDIERAPYRRLDSSWVSAAEANRGMIETDYLFNSVPSSGVARILPGPRGSAFLHYMVQIAPENMTLAREEGGTTYFTRFEVRGEVTGAEGEMIHQFGASPYLTLTQSELREVGARPFAYRGMFPLIEGEWSFRLIVKNDARSEYTIFESTVSVPAQGEDPWIGAAVLLHEPAERQENEIGYGTWAPAGMRLNPQAAPVVPAGGTLHLCVPVRNATDLEVAVRPAAHAPGQGDLDGIPDAMAALAAARQRISHSESGSGFDCLPVSLPLAGLPNGSYEVVAMDSAGAPWSVSGFDAIPRRSVALPWAFRDTFDAESPGAVEATLAQQWLNLKEFGRARPLFEDAVEQNPNLIGPRIALGRIALDDGEPRTAVRLLEPALAQQPESVVILRLLGDAHSESGNPTRAVQLYERTLSLELPDAALLNALGLALVRLGENERAIAHLESSLELDEGQEQVRELIASLRAALRPPSR